MTNYEVWAFWYWPKTLHTMDEGTIKTPIPKCRLYWCSCLGWCSNFVGSESGQSVKLLQNMVHNTTQHHPPPPTHFLKCRKDGIPTMLSVLNNRSLCNIVRHIPTNENNKLNITYFPWLQREVTISNVCIFFFNSTYGVCDGGTAWGGGGRGEGDEINQRASSQL